LCALIERTCAHAKQFAQGLQETGFEVLNDVVINQVLVSLELRSNTRSDPARPGGRNVLVRRNSLARKDRDANQRVFLGDDGVGCGTQPAGNSPHRERMHRDVTHTGQMGCAGIAEKKLPAVRRA